MKHKAFWITFALFWLYWTGMAFADLPQRVLTGTGSDQSTNWGISNFTVCNDGTAPGYINCDATAVVTGFPIIAGRCIKVSTRNCGQLHYIGASSSLGVINAP